MILSGILNVGLADIFMETLNDYEATVCGGALNMWSYIKIYVGFIVTVMGIASYRVFDRIE